MTQNETKRKKGKRTICGRLMSLIVMLFLAVGIMNLSPALIVHAANNAGDFNVTGDAGWVYNEADSMLTFTENGTYTVTGDGKETTEQITVAENNIEVTVTLKNVNINVSGIDHTTAFSAKGAPDAKANVTVVLEGTSTLKSGKYRGGLVWNNTDADSSLEIRGEGSLTAIGGTDGAGIGGGPTCGGTNITISGGIINATGGSGGAGIGSGKSGDGSKITINGGTINATGGSSGAGIGKGSSPKSGSNVIINGGSIKASSITTPTDGDGHEVYKLKVDDISGINEVQVDDKTYTRTGNHSAADGAFYLYTTGQNHDIQVQNAVYYAVWNSSDSTFSLSPKAPKPVFTVQSTANSIKASVSNSLTEYGTVEYACMTGASTPGESAWKTKNRFTRLAAGSKYTIYVRFKGSDTLLGSSPASQKVYTTMARPLASVVSFDYGKETISFDDATYEVNDTSEFTGTSLTSGASIRSYIVLDGKTAKKLYVRAKAVEGGAQESTSTEIPVLTRPIRPAANVTEGTYVSNKNITLSTTTDDAVIYYTTDGSAPSVTDENKYQGAISVEGKPAKSITKIIRAIAVKDGVASKETSLEYTINLPVNNAGDFYVAGDSGWEYDDTKNTLTFTEDGTYKVTGDGKATKEQIIVAENNIEATITLNNVYIDVSGIDHTTAFSAKGAPDAKANVTIVLQGTNTLKSGKYRGGLVWNNTNGDSSLEIKGEGSLTATGGSEGAGIGGGPTCAGSNIIISGGTITATGLYGGAGIGSGHSGYGSNVKINGGTVTATQTGGGDAAGIGNGNSSKSASNIIINGGSVKAGSISKTPTNEGGQKVYKLKVDDTSGINEVQVDDKTYTRTGNHSGEDGAFYLYTTGQNHDIQVQDTHYDAVWNSSNSTFSVKPPKPIFIVNPAANSISVSVSNRLTGYGIAQYACMTGTTTPVESDWKTTNTLTGLNAASKYTIYVRFAKSTTYIASDMASQEVYTTVGQPLASAVSLDYEEETLSFDTTVYEVNDTSDFTGASLTSGDSIQGYIVSDGTTAMKLYVRTKAAGDAPASAPTEIPVLARPAQPVANVSGGDYTSNQSITLSTTTSGASIYYTTDGSVPSVTAENKYQGAISVEGKPTESISTAIRAIAVKDDMVSTEASLEYTINLPENIAPVVTIKKGDSSWNTFSTDITYQDFYKTTNTFSIEATDNVGVAATQYYVSDEKLTKETIKTITDWKTYNGTFSITEKGRKILYAKVADAAGNETIVSTDGMVIYTDSLLKTPSLTHILAEDGDKKVNVELNANTIQSISEGNTTLDADSDYTVSTDGTITLKSDYLNGLSAGTHTLTIRYNPFGETYVTKDTNDAPSVSTLEMTVKKGTVLAPAASLKPGTYNTNQNVSLSSGTKDAVIYYTTDGSTPSAAKAIKYTGAIRLEGTAGRNVTKTIRAIAVKDGVESNVAAYAYNINLPEETPAQPGSFKVKKTGKTFTLSWKNVSGANGYQVQEKKSGQKSWKNIKKVKKLSKTKWRTSNYIKGKTYQYKVRAYKVVNGKKVYGQWSKVVKIKK